MRMRTTFLVFLAAVLSLAALGAARPARRAPAETAKLKGHREICIVCLGEVWSEIAPCG